MQSEEEIICYYNNVNGFKDINSFCIEIRNCALFIL